VSNFAALGFCHINLRGALLLASLSLLTNGTVYT
jgi:hypothetical protein